jgi:flavodoxin
VNTLIVYKSYHRMNTEKVAKAMAEAMKAQLTKVEDARPEALAGYDLIGFGSGIYGLKHHKALIDLIEAMPAMDKNVFVFSTCGNLREVNHKLIKEKLTERGCHIVGEFTCFGEFAGALRLNRDWKGALAFIGGKNKGHPDEKDLENARAFAKGLLGTSSTTSSL